MGVIEKAWHIGGGAASRPTALVEAGKPTQSLKVNRPKHFHPQRMRTKGKGPAGKRAGGAAWAGRR